MELGIKGKVAIVTGGAKGIGQAIVEALAGEGVNIVISDVLLDEAQKLAEKLNKNGVRVLALKTDVSRKPDAEELVSATLEEFGKIDILVNNAGVCRNIPFVDIEEEEWDRVLDINAKGIYLVTRAVVPQMIASKQGRIVNISSVAGKRGSAGVAHYSASKFAVIGLTQTLALELGKYNITVNAVCPGIVRTDLWEELQASRAETRGVSTSEYFEKLLEQVPLGRPQEPEDVANVVLFLSSEAAKNITGESISVNGGWYMD